MNLLNDTYVVTTYEDFADANLRRETANKHFHDAHRNYLITCLCEAGFANKRVRVKRTGCIGVLRVEEDAYPSLKYRVNFYPIRKDGEVSLKTRYVSGLHAFDSKDFVERLEGLFEIAGDENES